MFAATLSRQRHPGRSVRGDSRAPLLGRPRPEWHDPDVRPRLRGPLLTRGDHRWRRGSLRGNRPRDDYCREEDLPQEGAMTMTDHPEQLPQPAAALERLAEYYGTHDTSGDMEHGEWVEPQPMATTSLRLPAEVISQLKRQASARHVRSILERAALGGTPPEIAEITERLERIERAVTSSQTPGDQKTA